LNIESGECDQETHTIQVLDKPHQILVLEVRKASNILLPIKELDELTAKLWRRPVEVAES